jgi:hypothetical protein
VRHWGGRKNKDPSYFFAGKNLKKKKKLKQTVMNVVIKKLLK